MLQIFKTNKAILAILFIPYAFLLRSFGFFREIPSEFDNGGLFSDWVYENIGTSPTLSASLAFSLVLIQAFFIVIFTNREKLASERNLYGGIFYLLIASLNIQFLGLTPALMGNTFLLLALANFLEIYKMKEPAGKHFNAGFWLAIAALFYGSLFLFFFFGILAMILMRAMNVKEFLQYFAGYIIIFFLLFTYFLFTGDVQDSYFAYLQSSFGVMDFAFERLNGGDIVTICVLSLLGLACLLGYGTLIDRKGIKARKDTNVYFFFILFAIFSINIQAGGDIGHFIILAIPLGILSGQIFAGIKRPIWSESFHLILFALVPISHYLL